MDHLVEACKNIEQLHITFDYCSSSTDMFDFSTYIRFNQLIWLTLDVEDLSDGSFLPSVPNVFI